MNQQLKRVTMEKLAVFTDERGVVFNPIEISALVDQQNFHVVISRPRAIRGNHYHQRGTEIIIIMGPALVRIRESGGLRDIDIPDQSVYRLDIPPGVSHAVKHTGLADGLLLSFNSTGYDPESPDVIPDHLL